VLVQYSQDVTGLDASPVLKRAQQNVPQAHYVEAFAENMPFPDNQFDLVHTSAALHEMEPSQLRQILKVYRVLKPAGCLPWWIFTLPVIGYFGLGCLCFLCCLKPKQRGNC